MKFVRKIQSFLALTLCCVAVSASVLIVQPQQQGAFTPLDVAERWYWANTRDGQYTDTGGDHPELLTQVNLATPGTNDFFNNEGTGGGVEIGGTWGGYTTSLAVMAVERYADAFQIGRQAMSQSTSMGATGEFYLLGVGLNKRSDGERYLHGDEQIGDYSRISQVSNYFEIAFNSSETKISASGSVPEEFIVEIWRDSSNNIHCWINGVDATLGTPNNSSTFNLNGWGGGENTGGSGWDDVLLEVFAADGLPDAATRLELRTYFNDIWGIY